jgi:hypothetical protein
MSDYLKEINSIKYEITKTRLRIKNIFFQSIVDNLENTAGFEKRFNVIRSDNPKICLYSSKSPIRFTYLKYNKEFFEYLMHKIEEDYMKEDLNQLYDELSEINGNLEKPPIRYSIKKKNNKKHLISSSDLERVRIYDSGSDMKNIIEGRVFYENIYTVDDFDEYEDCYSNIKDKLKLDLEDTKKLEESIKKKTSVFKFIDNL